MQPAARRLEPGGGGLLQSGLDPARPVRRLIYIALFVAIAPWLVIGVVDAAGGEDHGDGYFVRAIFDNASSLVPGEDVKIAGAAVGVVDSLEVTDDKKAAVTLRIDDEDFTPWKADAHCTIRPQSLIGEKFVECEPGTAPLRRCGRIEKGDGEGERSCRSRAPARPSTSTC